MVFKREFQRCQKKSSSLFEQKNGFIPFELWTVAVETYFAGSAKNCEQQSFPQVNQSSFLRLVQMVFKRKFQRCQEKSSSLFAQKNGFIPFELWTVAVETYFAEYAKNCEQHSFAPVNQSSFLRLLQMVFKREFQRCQKKSSSLFEQKNGLIPFELWTVALETYFAESGKNCEKQCMIQMISLQNRCFNEWYFNETFNVDKKTFSGIIAAVERAYSTETGDCNVRNVLYRSAKN